MAHARKPKGVKRRAGEQGTPSSHSSMNGEQVSVVEQRKMKRMKQSAETVGAPEAVGDGDDRSVEKKKPRAPVLFMDGEKVQVQTAISRLSKDMNRPSVFFKLGAADFLERFTECFKEHIEGFVGLRGSKRERTEKEKNMEWRTRVGDLKKQKEKIVDVRKSGQTVSEKDRLLAIQRYRELRANKKQQAIVGGNTDST